MANTLYDSARKAFALGNFDWENDDIRVCLIDTGQYTYSASHDTMANVAVGAIVGGATGVALATSVGEGYGVQTNGAVDAGDATFTSVTGASIEAIIIYKYVSATASDNPLIAYLDSATGLPITPNGGDIIITWDNGTNKIFRL